MTTNIARVLYHSPPELEPIERLVLAVIADHNGHPSRGRLVRCFGQGVTATLELLEQRDVIRPDGDGFDIRWDLFSEEVANS